jgi:hypothetical protein
MEPGNVQWRIFDIRNGVKYYTAGWIETGKNNLIIK